MAGLLSGEHHAWPSWTTEDGGQPTDETISAEVSSKPNGPIRRLSSVLRSAPFTGAAAIERDDLAPRRRVQAILRQLLRDAQQPLATLHLRPHVLGMDVGGHPKHHEVIEEVGALAHHRVGMAVHGVDHNLDR